MPRTPRTANQDTPHQLDAAKDDPRAAILRAAAEHVARDGLEAASMERIRLHAGVSNGSLYHFFPTKAALAQGLYFEALASFQSAGLAAIAKDRPAEAGLRGLLRAYFAWTGRNPEYARILRDLRRNDAVAGAQALREANDAAFGALRAWVSRHTGPGEFVALPFEVWMAVVFAPALALTRGASTPAAGAQRALADAAWRAVSARD
jgi:AcrR family transcriptional regulator